MVSWTDERPTFHARDGRQRTTRSAVVLATQPLIAEILARYLERAGADSVTKHETVEGALDAVEDGASVLLLDLRGAELVDVIADARELVPELSTVAFVDPFTSALDAARAAGATVATSQTELSWAVRRAFEGDVSEGAVPPLTR
jgi:hypothetical protein